MLGLGWQNNVIGSSKESILCSVQRMGGALPTPGVDQPLLNFLQKTDRH
jgi:hypothetical protein